MRSNAGEDAMPSTLITGANRGLGLEFARQYAADGWQVYAACRDPSSASELRRLAETSGHKLRILAFDVTDPVQGGCHKTRRAGYRPSPQQCRRRRSSWSDGR